jgi:serine/threonine protein phosphatase PrpC
VGRFFLFFVSFLSFFSFHAMSISSASRTSIGMGRENQDACYVGERRFCVADGHGPLGRVVAETVCSTMRNALPIDSYEDIFVCVDEAVGAINNIRTILSGATASALTVEIDGACRVAHVGDSEVRYYDSNETGVSLTLDHSASNIDEFHRIHALPDAASFIFAGGPRYLPPRPVFAGLGDEWQPNPLGGFQHCNVRKEWSTYISANGNHLAVTRAFGDFSMRKHGLIATPSVVTAPPPVAGTTRAIVLASDGLWDCMQYSEVGAIVRNPECLGNAELAADRLLAAANAHAAERFGGGRDDISIIIVYVTAP